MSESETDQIQRRIVFSGRVQGVGFRFRTAEIASRYEVGGFVQNQPDGTVLLAVCGDQSQVDAMIGDVQSTMARYIEDMVTSPDDNSIEWKHFEIRR